MPLLTVSSITKSFVENVIFQNISFEVSENDRIGLVGVNGCGKTTLFRVITGTEPIDSGSVNKSRDVKLGVMSQSITADSDETLYEYVLHEFDDLKAMEHELERLSDLISQTPDEKLIKRQTELNDRFIFKDGLTYKARVRSTLLGLGFSEDELKKSIHNFSGGQKNKAQLARVLLSGADLLLLDEPTNHLDIDAASWLEDFLKSYNGAFIVISHDRYFLDRVTNKTFELKNQKLFITNGNYTTHVERKSTEREIAMRQYRNTQREIRRIEGIVEQQRRWGQERNFVTAASKLKQIEKLKSTLVEPEREQGSIRFSFNAKESMATDVLIASDLSKSYNGRQIFKDCNLHIRNGERVFLLGANGCGKTTLLRILARMEYPDSGSMTYGPMIQSGYYDQNVNAGVRAGQTLLDEVHDAYPLMNLGEIRSAMARFLFRDDDVFKEADKASGGERARVRLLKIMLSGANMLLLDEPTNHLDIASKEALESALEEYEGTMLIVTHDRYLVNRLADRVLHMTPTGLKEYIGGYDEFLAATEAEREENAKSSTEKKIGDNALQYKQKKELKSQINRTRGELERTEKAISETESAITQLEEQLSLPEVCTDYKKTAEIAQSIEEKKAECDRLYEKWEELSEKLNSLEQEA